MYGGNLHQWLTPGGGGRGAPPPGPPPPAPAPTAELPRYPVRPTDPFHYCACGLLVERPARRCDACVARALALRTELGMAEVA